MAKGPAPVNLNLLTVAFPITAVVSILHRISGVLLFLAMPPLLYVFHLSLQDAEGYARVVSVTGAWPVRLGLLLMGWALLHHLFAGTRFLLLDLDIGLSRSQARATAWLVVVGALVALILLSLVL